MELQAILDSTDDDDSSSSSLSPDQCHGQSHGRLPRGVIVGRAVGTGGGSASLTSGSSHDIHQMNYRGGANNSSSRYNSSDLQQYPSPTYLSTNGGLGGGSRSGEVDLEQILREDDDDDDDDDSDDLSHSANGAGISRETVPDSHDDVYHYSRRDRSSHRRQHETSRRDQPFTNNTSTATTPEEWDVLQAILGEDDEDDHDGYSGGGAGGGGSYGQNVSVLYDEDGEDDHDHVMVRSSDVYYLSSSSSKYGRIAPSAQNKNVDMILQQSDDEDDGDDLDGLNDFPVPSSLKREITPRSYMYSYHSSRSDKNNNIGDCHDDDDLDLTNAQIDSFVTAQQSQSQESSEYMDDILQAASTDDAVSPPNKKGQQMTAKNYEEPSHVLGGMKSFTRTTAPRSHQHGFGTASTPNRKDPVIVSTDEDLERASCEALKFALGQEKKLLKAGHRDIVSPLMVKRRLKPKIELGTRMQKQQQQQQSQRDSSSSNKKNTTTSTPTAMTMSSSVAMGGPRFNFSGGSVIDSQIMKGVSKSIYDRCRSHHDLPTALGINSRFIAVGTQKGIILVFDLFEVLRQKLGGSSAAVGDGSAHFNHKTAGSVTTIDLSLIHGEFLAAGYTSGSIVLWDTIKGAALKSIIETSNPSPIVSVRFLSDLKLVTVDAGGLVNKLNYSKNVLWTTYSVDSECLLDGTAGQILAMNVLAPYQYVKHSLPSDSMTSSMKKLVLIALSSERSSFAVAVEPKVHVLHRWAKPTAERIVCPHNSSTSSSSQVYLPCLSWGWALVSGGGHVINPILARAWGCCIQLLRASFPEPGDECDQMGPQEAFQWPAFGLHDEFDVDIPVVALEWLNDRSLVYLSMNNEFTVVDTVMMTLLERLDFSGLKLVYAEFSLSRKVAPAGPGEEDRTSNKDRETYFCTTFQNSFRTCDNRLLLLCQEEVKKAAIVGALPRISSLENDGEWLEALALALDHYENTIKSQEDRRRDQYGRKDLSKHPGLRSHLDKVGRTDDEEWIAKLLIRYLNIAVENAPETDGDDLPPELRRSQIELARSHFQMLAGVCVEFCVVTKRLDLLFGPIFRRFHQSGFLDVFLDVLEPYILNDKLDYIAPEAMIHFIEHCRANNDIATVERCLLHMDVTIMDFDTILGLLKVNEMYSALFYVYNQGLSDFISPLEILCERIFDAADTVGSATERKRRLDGKPQNDVERYGYKAILYLQSCFRGRTFPQNVELDEDQAQKVRPELLRFLTQPSYRPSRSVKKHLHIIGQRAVRYPYTHVLLSVDPKAMMDTFALAINASTEDSEGISNTEPIGVWEVDPRSHHSTESMGVNCPDRQEIITMLLSILIPSTADMAITHQTTLYQSTVTVNAFLDFLAEYLMKGMFQTNKDVTFSILERMVNRYISAKSPEDRLHWQGQVLALLTALPRSSYDTDSTLTLVQKAGINRAALILHQEEASVWPLNDEAIGRRSLHFCAAIDCYLDDDDPEFRKEVFAYVKKECSGASYDEGGKENTSLRDSLGTKLTDLVLLDALLTAELTADLYVDDPDLVIRNLGDDEAKFMFLNAIISGDLNELDPVAGSVLNAQLTMDHHHHYMALTAKLYPDHVYDYLSTHDNYRAEECLKLCQKYDIADASAYLLERMGNVTSALQLILQTMESRMMTLKRTIRGMGTESFEKYYPRVSRYSRHSPWNHRPTSGSSDVPGKQQKEIDGLKRILVVALDVCERNSGGFNGRVETEHGSQLWFNVLDRLINAKGFLRLSKEQPVHAKVMAGVLSELLRMTMQRMVSSVPLPDLVRKVTSDHSGSRLGELREMIESLLITYGLELDVFRGAVGVFHDDVRQMEKAHHTGRVCGANINSVMSIRLWEGGSETRSALAEVRESHNILVIGSKRGNATASTSTTATTPGVHTSKSNKNSRGFGDALSRLRTRRQRGLFQGHEGGRNNFQSPRTNNQQTFGLNLMTSEEYVYRQGLTSENVTYFEDRQPGHLGDAEHRGRIMSFMY